MIFAQGKSGTGGDVAGEALQDERLALSLQGLIGPGMACCLPEFGLHWMATLAAIGTKKGERLAFTGLILVQGIDLLLDLGDYSLDLRGFGHGLLQGQEGIAEAAGCCLSACRARDQGLLQGLDLLFHCFSVLFNQLDLVDVLRLLQILSLSHPLDLPVKSVQSVAHPGQFFFSCHSPPAVFIPVNSEDPLIFSLTIGLGDQGVVDLLRVHVATVQVSGKNEVDGRKLLGYLLILGRRQAGKQDQDVTLTGGFFNQGGQHCPPVCMSDTCWQGGNSAGQTNDPSFYLPDFFDPHRLKQWMTILVKEIGRQPGKSLFLTGLQQGKACCQIKRSDRHRVHLHCGIDLDDALSCQLLLGWPVWYLRLLEEQIAGVNKEMWLVLFCCHAFDLECFFGQPAQLIGVSTAGLSLSLDIVGEKEEEGLRGGGVESCGYCQKGYEEHDGKYTNADESAGREMEIIFWIHRVPVFAVEGSAAIY